MKYSVKRITKLGWPFVILFVLLIVILRERMGLATEDTRQAYEGYGNRLLTLEEGAFSPAVEPTRECLIIADSGEEQSNVLQKDIMYILDSMKIGYDICDLAAEEIPSLEAYEKIVLTISGLKTMGDRIVTVCDWVAAGGQLMNTGTFVNDGMFAILAAKAGIINSEMPSYTEVYGMRIAEGFMLNADHREFVYGEPSLTAMDIAVFPECKVYIEEVSSGIPLLWERSYGEGKFVIMNQVLTSKINRGMLCAAYSLLGDACVYPVINGSAYYLDDFPSPVPLGDSIYVSEAYGVSISNFYSNIWWPDILELKEKYQISHTGMIIEEYSDIVEAPFEEMQSKERFLFFGNMLLNHNGELGFHGYNHMPLTLEKDEDTKGGYQEWPSVEAMAESLRELERFSKELFPEENFMVYVPPSNILSPEGRRMLAEEFPDIKVVASTYFEGKRAYTQEFEVAEDGMVETPRITSGCDIDDYMMLAAFSELNFHYVQSHFMHPDDVLDEDRGAASGWEALYERLEKYIEYIDKAAPGLRNVTGSGMGQAVREYDKVTVQRLYEKDKIKLSLGGFYQEAYFMLRVNEGSPSGVEGGRLKHLTGNLYLIHATDSEVTITLGQK